MGRSIAVWTLLWCTQRLREEGENSPADLALSSSNTAHCSVFSHAFVSCGGWAPSAAFLWWVLQHVMMAGENNDEMWLAEHYCRDYKHCCIAHLSDLCAHFYFGWQQWHEIRLDRYYSSKVMKRTNGTWRKMYLYSWNAPYFTTYFYPFCLRFLASSLSWDCKAEECLSLRLVTGSCISGDDSSSPLFPSALCAGNVNPLSTVVTSPYISCKGKQTPTLTVSIYAFIPAKSINQHSSWENTYGMSKHGASFNHTCNATLRDW